MSMSLVVCFFTPASFAQSALPLGASTTCEDCRWREGGPAFERSCVVVCHYLRILLLFLCCFTFVFGAIAVAHFGRTMLALVLNQVGAEDVGSSDCTSISGSEFRRILAASMSSKLKGFGITVIVASCGPRCGQ